MRRNIVLIATALLNLVPLPAQAPPQDPLLRWMDKIAQQQLQVRENAIATVRTRADAERRKEFVHHRILEALGGLPDYAGPLNARVTGQIQADGYVIEKVIYESLPGYYVTANLYRPNRPGRYPAVLLQAGHTQEGKAEPQMLAANLALKGFVSLAFDPAGQGEESRPTSAVEAPAAGWSVNEHIHAGAHSNTAGEGLAASLHLGRQAIDRLPRQPSRSGPGETGSCRLLGRRRADHIHRGPGRAAQSGDPRLLSEFVSAVICGKRSPFGNDPSPTSLSGVGYGGFRGIIRSNTMVDSGDRAGLFHPTWGQARL